MDDLILCEEVINCYSLINEKTITYSEIILSMIELNRNPMKYGIYAQLNSKKFWKNLLNNKYIGEIFSKYRNDTIRKYWDIIKKCKSIKRIISIINAHKMLIDTNGGKRLGYLIKKIVKFADSDFDIKEFPAFLKNKGIFNKNTKGKKEKKKGNKKGRKKIYTITIIDDKSEEKKMKALNLCEKIFIKFKNKLFPEDDEKIQKLELLMKKRSNDNSFINN